MLLKTLPAAITKLEDPAELGKFLLTIETLKQYLGKFVGVVSLKPIHQEQSILVHLSRFRDLLLVLENGFDVGGRMFQFHIFKEITNQISVSEGERKISILFSKEHFDQSKE
jgi:hypothetical protein